MAARYCVDPVPLKLLLSLMTFEQHVFRIAFFMGFFLVASRQRFRVQACCRFSNTQTSHQPSDCWHRVTCQNVGIYFNNNKQTFLKECLKFENRTLMENCL